MKVVINACYGGFGVSLEAVRYMAKKGSNLAQENVAKHEAKMQRFNRYKDTGETTEGHWDGEYKFFDINIKYNSLPDFYSEDYERHDPFLVDAVETLGEKASGQYAKLKVVEVPDGVEYGISEYDGIEHIAEKHRTWA